MAGAQSCEAAKERLLVSKLLDFTPGLQCCLRCGRLLTDRVLHDALEDPVLATIRAEHPEWRSIDGNCGPCVEQYRSLLRDRQTREDRVAEREARRFRPVWISKLLGRKGQLAEYAQ